MSFTIHPHRRLSAFCPVTYSADLFEGLYKVFRLSVFVIAGLFNLSILLLPAQADDVVTFEQLIQARSLKCMFVEGTQTDWRNGRLSTSPIKNERFELYFDSVDAKRQTARLIGNNGAADVRAVFTSRSLTFIEQTLSGNLNVTTVFPFYKKGTEEFVAVTSRHLTLPDDAPFPSQRHGTCRVWE